MTYNERYITSDGREFSNKSQAESHQTKLVEDMRRSALAGNSKNQYSLGELYFKGEHVNRSYAEAFKWHNMAASSYSDSQYRLGVMCYNGWGVARNYKEAFQWTEKAALRGNAEAIYFIGDLYYNGTGVTRNYIKAIEWYKKSNKTGAFNKLGDMYHDGVGVNINYEQARHYYGRAAQNNSGYAQYMLGNIYYYGNGVKINYPYAAEWYCMAKKNADANVRNKSEQMMEACFEKPVVKNLYRRKSLFALLVGLAAAIACPAIAGAIGDRGGILKVTGIILMFPAFFFVFYKLIPHMPTVWLKYRYGITDIKWSDVNKIRLFVSFMLAGFVFSVTEPFFTMITKLFLFDLLGEIVGIFAAIAIFFAAFVSFYRGAKKWIIAIVAITVISIATTSNQSDEPADIVIFEETVKGKVKPRETDVDEKGIFQFPIAKKGKFRRHFD